MARKFYRDESEAKLAGVCSGIAKYIKSTPSRVRLVMLIFFVLGRNVVLIYIGLWLLFPKGIYEEGTTRKLYRSPRNKKIAGVCSGIAECVDVKPNTVRLIWLVTAFLSNFFGFGILIYLLIWAMLPERIYYD